MMPKNRILTETDGPFATLSNRSLLPWDAGATLKQLAHIWKCDER